MGKEKTVCYHPSITTDHWDWAAQCKKRQKAARQPKIGCLAERHPLDKTATNNTTPRTTRMWSKLCPSNNNTNPHSPVVQWHNHKVHPAYLYASKKANKMVPQMPQNITFNRINTQQINQITFQKLNKQKNQPFTSHKEKAACAQPPCPPNQKEQANKYKRKIQLQAPPEQQNLP